MADRKYLDSSAARCKSCLNLLRQAAQSATHEDSSAQHLARQVEDQIGRFSLWMGNIGALHPPQSPLSLESRLKQAPDVLEHIRQVLEDLDEVTKDCKF